MTHRLSWLLLTLAGSACVSPKEGPSKVLFDACEPAELVAPADASPEERAGIALAASMWNGLGITHLVTASSTTVQAIPIVFSPAILIFFGEYDGDRGEVYVNRNLTEPHARAVTIAHEVGHAFGLLHVPSDARGSVMNPGNLVVEPTAEDERTLAGLFPSCAR